MDGAGMGGWVGGGGHAIREEDACRQEGIEGDRGGL